MRSDIKQNWRTGFGFGQKNVKNEPLITSVKISSPPLHIKFELVKNFVKARCKDERGFLFLKIKYPYI